MLMVLMLLMMLLMMAIITMAITCITNITATVCGDAVVGGGGGGGRVRQRNALLLLIGWRGRPPGRLSVQRIAGTARIGAGRRQRLHVHQSAGGGRRTEALSCGIRWIRDRRASGSAHFPVVGGHRRRLQQAIASLGIVDGRMAPIVIIIVTIIIVVIIIVLEVMLLSILVLLLLLRRVLLLVVTGRIHGQAIIANIAGRSG